jgi:hypothetical protein
VADEVEAGALVAVSVAAGGVGFEQLLANSATQLAANKDRGLRIEIILLCI